MNIRIDMGSVYRNGKGTASCDQSNDHNIIIISR